MVLLMLASPNQRYLTLLDATRRYSTLLDATRRYLTLFDATRRYWTLLDATRRYSTLLDATRRYSTLLDNTRRYSTLLDATLLYPSYLVITHNRYTLYKLMLLHPVKVFSLGNNPVHIRDHISARGLQVELCAVLNFSPGIGQHVTTQWEQ
jgi:hypothetical protein